MKNKIRSYSKKYSFKKKKSLLKLVDKEKKINKQTKKILKRDAEPIWVPSVNSFLKVSGVVLIFWFLIRPQYLYSWILLPVYDFSNYIFGNTIYYQNLISFLREILIYFPSFSVSINDYYQNLIVIHAGIGAILIGIAFFVAQNFLDKDEPDKGRILLYKSYFFPLLTAEILIFLLFLCGEPNIIPVIFIGIGTILSLGRVISTLLKEHEFEKAKLKMFKAIFVKVIDYEISKRIGNNILAKKYKDNKIIEVNPFGPINKEDYISIKTDRLGFVNNLYFKNLDKFIDEIQNKLKNKELIVNYNTGEVNNISAKNEVKKEIICYLIPRFYSELKESEGVLFWIKKEILQEEYNIKNLEKFAQQIFDIQESPEITFVARDELVKLKNKCFTAIDRKQNSDLEKKTKLYTKILEEYFNYLNFYGGGFSQKQAEQERGALFERLQTIEWLSRDIREIFNRGVISNDMDIVRTVAYIPILFAQRAIESKDHLIFQEFIYFPQLLYSYAVEEKKNNNEKLADFMFDRTWRYLKELSDFYLEPKLKKDGFSEEDFKGFSIYLFKIFQRLLKDTVDNRDIDNFRIFLSKTLKLFEHLNKFNYGSNKDKSTEIFKYLDQRRKQMMFGLASWIFHLWEMEQDKNVSVLKVFFNEVKNKLPIEIEDFTKVFLDSHDFETEKFWGWDDWEMHEKGEGEVHSIQILEKLEKFYAINSLILLQSKSDEEIKKIKLPHSIDLAFLAKGTRDLIKTLDDIESNPKNWKFVLNDDSIKRVQALKELLQKARQEQKEANLKKKRKISVSEEKINKFKENLIKDFYKNATLRNLLIHHKLYKDESSEEYFGDLKKLGVNTLFDKAPFFNDKVAWHVHFMGIDNGFDFGRSIANGENNEILERIKEKCVQEEEKDFETKLSAIKKLSNTIIIATNSAVWKFFEKSPNYMAKWNQNFSKQDVKEIEGLYTFNKYSIPVYQVFNNDKESYIFILDKTNFGQLVQYSPLDKKDDKIFKKDIFFMNVQEFSNVLSEAKKIVGNPKWLEEVGNEQKQLEYLQENILIHIFERFEYNINEDFEGYKFILES